MRIIGLSVAFLLGAIACADDEAVPPAVVTPDAGGGTTNDAHAEAGVVEPDASGPRVMVRIGNYAQPDFLDLDACFGFDGGAWVGPLWRDDWARGATYNRLTAYRRVAPGARSIRFVAHESADCNTAIVGIPDQNADVALASADGKDIWFTLLAQGAASGAGDAAFRLQTFVDRESGTTTPFAIRIVNLDRGAGPLEFGTVPDPEYKGYDVRIENVSFGQPSPYSSWDKQFDTPLYFGWKVFAQGQRAGAPWIVGNRAQSEATGRGSWSLFVLPARKEGADREWTLCADGADGPRLCYPCGTPSCEGQ